jgi:hypothetical protein
MHKTSEKKPAAAGLSFTEIVRPRFITLFFLTFPLSGSGLNIRHKVKIHRHASGAQRVHHRLNQPRAILALTES